MYLVALKTLHVLGAVLFLGAGLMTAYYKWRADRSGDVQVVAWCQREIVRADWIFTAPSGIILPTTGIALAMGYGLPLTTDWVMFGIVAFASAGALWLPAVWLQLAMRDLAVAAARDQQALSPRFHRYNAYWLALGAPAFALSVFAVWVMVAKQLPW